MYSGSLFGLRYGLNVPFVRSNVTSFLEIEPEIFQDVGEIFPCLVC